MFCLLCIVLLAGAAHTVPGPTGGHGSLAGRVTGREGGVPVPGASVTISRSVLGRSTDTSGSFVFGEIPSGSYTLVISSIGYRRMVLHGVTVVDQETTRVSVEMETEAVETAPVVISASRREQVPADLPVAVDVVDENALERRQSMTPDDALRYVPGVTVTQSQVNIRGSTGYSFGVGSRVLLLVDGMPMLSGDTGEIIWESLPLFSVSRIEVVKSAGSALYGSSALGGVINLIPAPIGDVPRTRIRAYGGMYDMPDYPSWRWTEDARRFGGVEISHQRLIGETGLSISAGRTTNDDYRRNNFWKRWNGSVRLEQDLSSSRAAMLSFSILDQQRGNFLYWQDLNHALEPPADELKESVHSTRWSLAAGYREFSGSAVLTQATASWYRSRWDDNIPSVQDSTGTRSVSDDVNGDLQFTVEPSGDNVVVAGVSASYADVHAESIFGVHDIAGGAVYLQDDLRLADSLTMSVGGRFDYRKIHNGEDFSQVNPKIGLVVHCSASARLRASAGRGFRAPSVAELYTVSTAGGVPIGPNPLLQPERSWSFEAGGSAELGFGLAIECSLFRNEFWDLIEPSFGNDGVIRFQNITRARVLGAEITLRQNLSGVFAGQLSYTELSPRDITAGDVLKYRPRHLLTASAQVALRPVLQAGIDVRYLSRTERIDDEFVTSGIVLQGDRRVPITVVDVHAAATAGVGGIPLTAAVHVYNLFRYYYVELIGNLAPPRNIVFSLEANL